MIGRTLILPCSIIYSNLSFGQRLHVIGHVSTASENGSTTIFNVSGAKRIRNTFQLNKRLGAWMIILPLPDCTVLVCAEWVMGLCVWLEGSPWVCVCPYVCVCRRLHGSGVAATLETLYDSPCNIHTQSITHKPWRHYAVDSAASLGIFHLARIEMRTPEPQSKAENQACQTVLVYSPRFIKHQYYYLIKRLQPSLEFCTILMSAHHRVNWKFVHHLQVDHPVCMCMCVYVCEYMQLA